MKLLESIEFDEVVPPGEKPQTRKTARAVLFDADSKIAILFVSKLNYHKLPGGGTEAGEDEITALRRECREEVGCEIEVIGELGIITEFKKRWNLHQESSCYLARVVGGKGTPHFQADEITDGFELKWMDLQEALDQIASEKPDDYEGKFIVKRDSRYLKEALSLVK